MTSDEAPRSRHPLPRAPLVGRDRELSELDAALSRVLENQVPQTVTLVGGAGIGKGRIVEEFLSRASGARSFRGDARPGGPMLGAIQQILRSRFEIVDASDPAARERLREQVAELLHDRRVTEFLHFLGAYLDITFPESPFTKALEGESDQLARISRAVLRR
ncbi:MAG TPA: hypothetical protein ENK57_02520, partial [Polyangiaceae bacterium]|nr:hypothetical protein [Polyangiaceae bacterium]